MARRLAHGTPWSRARPAYRSILRAEMTGLRSRSSSAAGLLLALLVLACGAADPLDSIRKQQEAGDFDGSLAPLRELLAQRPKDPEVNYLYGTALLYTSQPSLALFALRQAMDDPDWLVPAGLQLAQAGLASWDFNEVVRATTRILEQHPDEVQALLLRAQARAHWRQDAPLALADADRVLELRPDMVEAYEPKILALIALDRHPEAREALAEAGRRMSGTEVSKSVLAWHCSTTAIFSAEEGEIDTARRQHDGCLEKYPIDPTVVSNAIEFFDAHKDRERALEVMQAAHAAAPDERSFRVNLANRLRLAGKPGDGEAILLDATRADDPGLASAAWTDVATFRHGLGEHAAAAEAWERAIALVREHGKPEPQLLFQYADALVVSGQLDRALRVADEISVPAQKHLIVARVAQEQGQHAKALAEFDQALEVWPNNAFAHYYAALSAEKLGDFDRALEEYRYAIRTSVGATDARTRAARLLIAEGQPLKAYQLLFLEVGTAPLEPEGELLSMYLMARVANPNQVRTSLLALGRRDPVRYLAALARAADGAAEIAGPAAGVHMLEHAPGVDYTAPVSAGVDRALVRFAHAAKQTDVAERVVAAALKAHPEAAAFQALRGLHLELAKAPPDDVRAAYTKALQLDPQNVDALAGLGRLDLGTDPARALEYFERAEKADPNEVDRMLWTARALRANARPEEAAQHLDLLLDREPFEADAAAERVSIDLARGTVTPRTLDRALRAVRFGGSVEALERLSDVYTRLGQADEAAKAAERARALRERLASSRPAPQKQPDAEEQVDSRAPRPNS